MRIAHVITRMILGGAQENTFLSCRGLRQEYGDDVLLVTGPPLGPEGSLLDAVREAGIPVKILPELQRAIHPGRDWFSYFSIRRQLQEFAPDVVHTHSAKGGVLGRMAASSLKVPVIVHTVHGAPFHPHQNRMARATFRWCERYAAGKCHKLVSVADAMTDLMVQAGVAPREKFTTIYSGMEVEPFQRSDQQREETRRQLGYQPHHIVVGKVARLFHLKGHEDIIRAASQVIRQLPNVRFLWVGDGALRQRLVGKIEALGLQDNFQLTGLVKPQRIPSLIAAMDIVAHTSLREGLARVLPQSLISGRPVVSYDIDGAKEVVLPGQTGYLLPPGDTVGLSNVLMELAGDAKLRNRMGQEGRRRFLDQFRHQHMTRQLRELYKQLLRAATQQRSG